MSLAYIHVLEEGAAPESRPLHTDFERFTSSQKAVVYMVMTSGPGNPLLDDPVKAHSCENVTDPVTFFKKMSYRGYILFPIRFHSNFF